MPVQVRLQGLTPGAGRLECPLWCKKEAICFPTWGVLGAGSSISILHQKGQACILLFCLSFRQHPSSCPNCLLKSHWDSPTTAQVNIFKVRIRPLVTPPPPAHVPACLLHSRPQQQTGDSFSQRKKSTHHTLRKGISRLETSVLITRAWVSARCNVIARHPKILLRVSQTCLILSRESSCRVKIVGVSDYVVTPGCGRQMVLRGDGGSAPRRNPTPAGNWSRLPQAEAAWNYSVSNTTGADQLVWWRGRVPGRS